MIHLKITKERLEHLISHMDTLADYYQARSLKNSNIFFKVAKDAGITQEEFYILKEKEARAFSASLKLILLMEKDEI